MEGSKHDKIRREAFHQSESNEHCEENKFKKEVQLKRSLIFAYIFKEGVNFKF